MVLRTCLYTEERLATLEMEQGHYLDFTALLSLIPDPNNQSFWDFYHDNRDAVLAAQGSSHNHQAWEGGYLDHVVETMNIACQLYQTLNAARKLPFQLHEALEVMFLHDLEKPFKVGKLLIFNNPVTGEPQQLEATKSARKALRADLIDKYGIRLTDEQKNALEYVEGVPDSKYTPGERTMGELAAFCHCCDILSARLWHDKGHEVRGGSTSWE
jgi:hypothetical protein